MTMSRDDFISLLKPQQIGFFSAAIRGGLALYADPNNYSPRALIDHNKAVRAQIRNAHIVNEARRLMAADQSLGIIERDLRRRILFLVSSQVYVSFKRLDDDLRGHGSSDHSSGTLQPATVARFIWARKTPRDWQHCRRGTAPLTLET